MSWLSRMVTSKPKDTPAPVLGMSGVDVKNGIVAPIAITPPPGGTAIHFQTPLGVDIVVMGSGMTVGNPTGGLLGAGTLNVERIAVNGADVSGGGGGGDVTQAGNNAFTGTNSFTVRPTFAGAIPYDNGNLDVSTLATTAGVTTTLTSYATLAAMAATYLTQSSAASTYLTSTSANATFAPKANPTFTGIPAAPTATAGTNTTQIATTQYVTSAVGGEATLRATAITNAVNTAVPTATTAQLYGGSGAAGNADVVTVGTNLSLTGGTLSNTYALPVATAAVLGGVKPDGTTITNTAGVVKVAYGTAANTAAQGNDSRITGALAAATAASTYTPLTLVGSPAYIYIPTITAAAIAAASPSGTPNGSGVASILLPRAITFPAHLATSLAAAAAPPGGATVFTIHLNGTPVSQITVDGTGAATYSLPSGGSDTPVLGAAGNLLAITLDSGTPGSMGDLAVTLIGAYA